MTDKSSKPEIIWHEALHTIYRKSREDKSVNLSLDQALKEFFYQVNCNENKDKLKELESQLEVRVIKMIPCDQDELGFPFLPSVETVRVSVNENRVKPMEDNNHPLSDIVKSQAAKNGHTITYIEMVAPEAEDFLGLPTSNKGNSDWMDRPIHPEIEKFLASSQSYLSQMTDSEVSDRIDKKSFNAFEMDEICYRCSKEWGMGHRLPKGECLDGGLTFIPTNGAKYLPSIGRWDAQDVAINSNVMSKPKIYSGECPCGLRVCEYHLVK
jgi:hypothetical protein